MIVLGINCDEFQQKHVSLPTLVTLVKLKAISKAYPFFNSEKSMSTSKRPVKPKQKVVGVKSSVGPKSSTGVPMKSAVVCTSHREYKPPFVMYGSRDKEIKIGQQKTHNIRALVDVSIILFTKYDTM